MAVTKRDGSKFWYIQFQFNGKTFIKSSKTTDKQLAHDLESQWRMQLIKQHQLGTKAPIDIPKAFQIFTNSKKDIKTHPRLVRYLTEGEEQRLFVEVNPYRDVDGMPPFSQRNGIVKQQMIDLYHLIILLLDTGARHSEICNLKWENIDLEKKTIALWRTKVQNESVLYMTDRVVNVLTERYKKRISTYIFTSKQGNARRTLTHVIQRAFKRAGLEGCSAHTLTLC
jgi:integrase